MRAAAKLIQLNPGKSDRLRANLEQFKHIEEYYKLHANDKNDETGISDDYDFARMYLLQAVEAEQRASRAIGARLFGLIFGKRR